MLLEEDEVIWTPRPVIELHFFRLNPLLRATGDAWLRVFQLVPLKFVDLSQIVLLVRPSSEFDLYVDDELLLAAWIVDNATSATMYSAQECNKKQAIIIKTIFFIP